MTDKNNPVKFKNLAMRTRYSNHLCLHCANLSYWDWYICKKRHFYFRDYYFINLIKQWWNRAAWLVGECSLQSIIEQLFNIEQFIPDKPVRKCKYYDYSDRKVFWTKIVAQDGTTWEDDGK